MFLMSSYGCKFNHGWFYRGCKFVMNDICDENNFRGGILDESAFGKIEKL